MFGRRERRYGDWEAMQLALNNVARAPPASGFVDALEDSQV